MSAVTPKQRYAAELESGLLLPDPVQEHVVSELERVHQEMVARPVERSAAASGGLFGGFKRRLGRDPPTVAAVPGVYLWGGVGRGKTHLMNAFFEGLPFPRKQRVHFHRFMQRVHADLKRLKEQAHPLRAVAEQWSKEARVLCFDEFHVSDIADAMLLAGLLEGLFARGVTLVATSNVAPDDLYAGGLQRARFLPAIELIKRQTRVVHVGGDADYRLRALESAEIYHHPLDEAAEVSLLKSFSSLSPDNPSEGGELEILGRTIGTERSAEGIVWFDFEQICDGPRGAADYIEIARLFHTVFISNVPVIRAHESDRAQRFISLVDEFYDRNVNLILSAEAPPSELYAGNRKKFEFQRTTSRLQEMQSHDYLARKHLP